MVAHPVLGTTQCRCLQVGGRELALAAETLDVRTLDSAGGAIEVEAGDGQWRAGAYIEI